MSFSDDDKDALGQDLDEIKNRLSNSERYLSMIHTNIKTVTTIMVTQVIISVLLGVYIGVSLNS